MHKRTHLTVTEEMPASRLRSPKKRTNRRRRNWHLPLRWAALGVAVVEAGLLLFANPYLHVTKVRVDGVQTLSSQEVFEEARVPSHANIFGILRQPFGRRLTANPVIDHATRTVHLPNLLVLTVTERQPHAVLAGGGQFWLLDDKFIAYRQLDRPLPGVPTVQAASAVMPTEITPGRCLRSAWLADAFDLLHLLPGNPRMAGLKVVVDQNSNLCLNRADGLQIRLGQPDVLPQKLALAEAAVSAHGSDSLYIDVSSPQQMVRMPRKDTLDKEKLGNNNGLEPRTD